MAYVRDGLTWKIGNGRLAHIGMDPWIRCGNCHLLPQRLMHNLSDVDYTNLAHIADHEYNNLLKKAWKDTDTLGIPPHWQDNWHTYINALKESHVRVSSGDDELN